MQNMLSKEIRMTSVEVCDMINQFREMEGNRVELTHSDLMKKIRKELSMLESLGLDGHRNISESSYTNQQNKTQPCFSLNRDAIIQISMSESAIVRYKLIEYVNTLESKLAEVRQIPDLLYAIYNGGVDAVTASKTLVELETAPLKEEIAVQKPKVEYYEKVISTTDSITVTQIAKELGMTAQALNKKLNELGVQYKVKGQWVLTAKYQDKGYTDTKTTTYENSLGETKTSINTQWTQKGREFIHSMIEDERDLDKLLAIIEPKK